MPNISCKALSYHHLRVKISVNKEKCVNKHDLKRMKVTTATYVKHEYLQILAG